MDVGSHCVDFVETKPLIKPQGSIKLRNLEANRPLTHHGLGLELADQCTSDSSLAVLWEDRKVRQPNRVTHLQQDHSPNGFIIQQHDPIVRSWCERTVVAGEAQIHELDEPVLLLCVQGDELKLLRVSRTEKPIEKFLVIRSSWAERENLAHQKWSAAASENLSDDLPSAT
jgi:hypothetical protein